MKPTSTTIDEVRAVVVTSLGVDDRADTLSGSTPLLGSLPELDSLAVVQLVYALEDRFGLTISDDEISAEIFETLGSLANFIENRLLTPIAGCMPFSTSAEAMRRIEGSEAK